MSGMFPGEPSLKFSKLSGRKCVAGFKACWVGRLVNSIVDVLRVNYMCVEKVCTHFMQAENYKLGWRKLTKSGGPNPCIRNEVTVAALCV